MIMHESFPFYKTSELTMDLSKCDLLKYTPMKLDDWCLKKLIDILNIVNEELAKI